MQYVHEYMSACVHIHMYVCRDQTLAFSAFLYCSPPYFLEWGLSLILPESLATESQGLPASAFLVSARIPGVRYHTRLLCGCWDYKLWSLGLHRRCSTHWALSFVIL